MRKLLLLTIAVFALVGCREDQDEKPDDPILYVDIYGLPTNVFYFGMSMSDAENLIVASGKVIDLRLGATAYLKIPKSNYDEHWCISGENELSNIVYSFESWDQGEVLSKKGEVEKYYNVTFDDHYVHYTHERRLRYIFSYRGVSSGAAIRYAISVSINKG